MDRSTPRDGMSSVVTPTSSVGTSVAPRQRPKGSSSSAGRERSLPQISSLPLLPPAQGSSRHDAVSPALQTTVSSGNICSVGGISPGVTAASEESIEKQDKSDPKWIEPEASQRPSGWNPFADDTFVPVHTAGKTTKTTAHFEQVKYLIIIHIG